MVFGNGNDGIEFWKTQDGNLSEKRDSLIAEINRPENSYFKGTLLGYGIITAEDGKTYSPKREFYGERFVDEEFMLAEFESREKPAVENMIGYMAFVQDIGEIKEKSFKKGGNITKIMFETKGLCNYATKIDEGNRYRVEIRYPIQHELREFLEKKFSRGDVCLEKEKIRELTWQQWNNQFQLAKEVGYSEEEIMGVEGNSILEKYVKLKEGNYPFARNILENAEESVWGMISLKMGGETL